MLLILILVAFLSFYFRTLSQTCYCLGKRLLVWEGQAAASFTRYRTLFYLLSFHSWLVPWVVRSYCMAECCDLCLLLLQCFHGSM